MEIMLHKWSRANSLPNMVLSHTYGTFPYAYARARTHTHKHMYLLAASSIVSPGWTFPPKPFHLPTPNPLFFIPSRTFPGWTTRTRVSSFGLNIWFSRKWRSTCRFAKTEIMPLRISCVSSDGCLGLYRHQQVSEKINTNTRLLA